MRQLRAVPLVLLLLIPAGGVVAAQDQPARGADGTERDPLDLSRYRIRTAAATRPITGAFRFVSPFGDGVHEVTIVETPGSFWRYEGILGDQPGRAFLKIDPAPPPTLYKGRLGAPLGDCLGEGSHVERVSVADDRIELDVLMPEIPSPSVPRSRRCADAITYELVAIGGERVRLMQVENPGSSTGASPLKPSPIGGAYFEPHDEAKDRAESEWKREGQGSANTFGRRVPSGSKVRVTGRMTDVRKRVWYRVELLEPLDEDDERAPTGWVRESEIVGRVKIVMERLDGARR